MSGILSIPLPVLEFMLSKAEKLINDWCVIPVPPSACREHIVCTGTRTFKVTSTGKGVDFKCGCQHISRSNYVMAVHSETDQKGKTF